MNPAALLSLLGDLYAQMAEAQQQTAEVQRQLEQARKENADFRSRVVEDDDIPPGPVDAP